jgi:hypothetical protein
VPPEKQQGSTLHARFIWERGQTDRQGQECVVDRALSFAASDTMLCNGENSPVAFTVIITNSPGMAGTTGLTAQFRIHGELNAEAQSPNLLVDVIVSRPRGAQARCFEFPPQLGQAWSHFRRALPAQRIRLASPGGDREHKRNPVPLLAQGIHRVRQISELLQARSLVLQLSEREGYRLARSKPQSSRLCILHEDGVVIVVHCGTRT